MACGAERLATRDIVKPNWTGLWPLTRVSYRRLRTLTKVVLGMTDRTAELEAAVRAQDKPIAEAQRLFEGVCGNQARASRRRH
jgi:hypothetical protein